MDLAVEVTEHIYTTDFFQLSAFRPEDQIISIYYFAKAMEPIRAPLRDKPFDFDEEQLRLYGERKEIETFRFLNWEDFSPEALTLPIDKLVAAMLKEKGPAALPL